MPLTRELHIIRVHHLHYISLLDDFGRHITFIRDIHNPALDHLAAEEREFSRKILKQECANLMTELHTQERRLKDLTGLVGV